MFTAKIIAVVFLSILLVIVLNETMKSVIQYRRIRKSATAPDAASFLIKDVFWGLFLSAIPGLIIYAATQTDHRNISWLIIVDVLTGLLLLRMLKMVVNNRRWYRANPGLAPRKPSTITAEIPSQDNARHWRCGFCHTDLPDDIKKTPINDSGQPPVELVTCPVCKEDNALYLPAVHSTDWMA